MKFASVIFVAIIIATMASDVLPLYAATGDTTRVELYAGRRFYTTGDMRYDQPVKFPAAGKTYSHIDFKLKLACPCGPLMGEWDYTVTFYARRATGRNDSLGNPINEYVEVARFITPYWKYKPANLEYTWKWDVTDYASLLQGDSVWIRTDYSGYSQSALFTAGFEFVEGEPPYTVVGIQTLWQGSWGYGNASNPINQYLANKKFKAPSNAATTRLRIITTGHGGGGTDNAAEFSDKTHTIWVGGQQRFSQRLWREDCMVNPVYPQDGTWPLSRGGWCPGDKIQPWEQDITSFLTAGDSTVVDYKMQDYTNLDPGHGASYTTTGQIIYCSAPNYQNNVALMEIKQPNSATPYNRMNPICGGPTIRIKNLGGQTLTRMNISYGIPDEFNMLAPWTGALKYLEEADVVLPPLPWSTFFKNNESSRSFFVKLVAPNSNVDEDSLNNIGNCTFSLPPIYYNDFEIRLLTNKQAAAQYSYTLTNTNGQLVSQRSGLSDNTLYVDSLNLPDGCYEFRFKNVAGYGLSWWATQADLGSGSLSLSSLGRNYLTFNGDFGGEIFHQFRVGPKPTAVTSTTELDFGSIDVNAKKQMQVTVTPQNATGLEITDMNIALKNRGYSILKTEPAFTDKLQLKLGDTLKITVEFYPTSAGNKITNLSISTNDQRNSSITVRLNGWGGPSGVEEDEKSSTLFLNAVPNVASDETTVTFGDAAGGNRQVRLSLLNSLGQEVAVVFNGTLNSPEQKLSLPTKTYPPGVYFLALRSGVTSITSPITILR